MDNKIDKKCPWCGAQAVAKTIKHESPQEVFMYECGTEQVYNRGCNWTDNVQFSMNCLREQVVQLQKRSDEKVRELRAELYAKEKAAPDATREQ